MTAPPQIAPTRPTATGFRPQNGSVLQRQCKCGGSAGPAGECEECCRRKRQRLQTKLQVSQPGDSFEQEAEKTADRVTSTPPQPGRNRAPLSLQRLPGSPSGKLEEAPASVDRVVASPGRPLEPSVREEMEERFGYDFAKVRVHADAGAAQSAQDVAARAYTVKNHIVFDAGAFAPQRRDGRQLLAHELTHVVQQQSAPAVQRQPVDDADDRGHPSAHAGPAPCLDWPRNLPTYGRAALKTAGRDAAIEYSIAVTAGHFCDTRPKSVGLLQYERQVRLRTATGREAMLHIVADAAFFPPFDSRKTGFEQLRVPADVSVRWEVAIKYGKDDKFDWFVPPGAEGRAVEHPRTPAGLKSLTQLADGQPSFVHLFVSPAEQQQSLEQFVEKSTPAKRPDDARRPRIEGWGQKRMRPVDRLPPHRPPPVAEKPKETEETPLSEMSEDQRYDFAREKIWEKTKANLKEMWEHPGQTLKGMGKSLLLLDTPEVFSGIAENLTEVFDSDANSWGRAAAGTEAAAKMSGWLAAVIGVLIAIVVVAAFVTGVGEVAAGLFAAGVALGALALALHGASSIMRAKAAGQAKTDAEFKRQVEAGANDLSSGIAGAVIIVATIVVHATAKAAFPSKIPQIRAYLDNLGKRLRAGRAQAPVVGEGGAAGRPAAPGGTAPTPPGFVERFLDQLQQAFGPKTATAGGPGDVPVPDSARGMESRSVKPKRTSPAKVEDLKPAAPPANDPAPMTAKGPKPKEPAVSRYSMESRANLAELDRKFPQLEEAHVTIRKRGTGPGIREETMFTNGGKESYQAVLRSGEGIQLDDISPDGTVIEIKMRTDVETLRARKIQDYVEERGRRDLDFDTNRHLDEHVQADAERAADRYIDMVQTKDLEGFEDQMARQQRFIEENGLPGGEWITDSPTAAEAMRDIIAKRGLTRLRVTLVR